MINLKNLAYQKDISQLAATLFNCSVKEDLWFHTPIHALNGKAPITRLSTDKGREEVRMILRKIEAGEFS